MAAAAVAAASVQSSRPRPAVVSAVAANLEADREATASLPTRADGSTTVRTIAAPNAPVAANAATTPSGMRWVVGPKSTIRAVPPTPPAAIPSVPATTVALAPQPKTQEARTVRQPEPAETRPAAARTGWMIQIGATADVDQANELLSRARSKSSALSGAKPFTEKVRSGGNTLYRARFAGLDNAADAQAACNALKRSGFGCFATRN
jgi:D-alanyl-D-alanine carboxypeptidase